MAWVRPTLNNIYDRIISNVEKQSSNIGGLFRRSVVRILSKSLATVVSQLYGHQVIIKNGIFVSTAKNDDLDIHGGEYGINRTEATKATGTCTATGTTGTSIPAGTELKSPGGIIYVVDDTEVITAGEASLDFTAKTGYEGSDGNDDAGVSLTFTSPITGVDSTATVDSDGINGGADLESDEDYRERILVRKRQAPHAGCENDYEVWAKEISGVTRSWCFPTYMGNGTVGVAFVRDDDDTILPNSTQREAMSAYLVEHTDPITGQTTGIPLTAEAGLYIIELEEKEIDFSIAISPNTTAVQEAVEDELEALLIADGGPGQTLRLSRISEAISAAASETHHTLTSPTADVACSYSQVPKLGTITWSDYS
jgi:uncharacterized phage protein gp47/JayE